MKIIVIGTPRTATSVTCELVSKKFRLRNLEYLPTNVIRFVRDRNKHINCDEIESAVSESLSSLDNFVVKYVGGCASLDSPVTLQKQLDFFSKFDQIIFCSRENLLDQYHSWLYLNQNIQEWITRTKAEMTRQITETHPEVLTWDFLGQDQILKLVNLYFPLHQVLQKNFKSTSFEVLNHEVNAETFIKQILQYRLIRSKISQTCPEKCHYFTYEMWQLPMNQITDCLSNALGVSIDIQDLEFLHNQKNQIDYKQRIKNLKAVDGFFSSINIKKEDL